MTCIYRIVLIGTNKCYIGSTKDLRIRKNLHVSSLRRQCHRSINLQRAWDKYGEESFEFEVVETCTEENRVAREIHWIKTADSRYNMVRVVDDNFRFSDEHKAKIGKALTGNQNGKNRVVSEAERSGMRERALGKTVSAETRAKISFANRGRVLSKETRKKMSEARKGIPTKGHKHTEETKKKISENSRNKSSCKLNEKDVKNIRKSKENWKELAILYDVSTYTIWDIRNYRTWTWVK